MTAVRLHRQSLTLLAGDAGLRGEIEVVGQHALETLVGDETVTAVIFAGGRGDGRQGTEGVVSGQLVVGLAESAVGDASALDAVGGAGRTTQDTGIEVEVGRSALVANGVVEAEVTTLLAGLAGQPREGDVVRPHRTLIVTVALIEVVLATLRAGPRRLVPPQTPELGVVVVAALPEECVADVVVEAGIVDETVGVDAGETVGGVLGAEVAPRRTGETQPGGRVVVGLRQAGAVVDVVVEVEGGGAVVGVVRLDVAGAVAVDGVEPDGRAPTQAGEAVGRTRTRLAPSDRLRAVLALRPPRVVEAADAEAAAGREYPVPPRHARPALRGERAHALVAGVGTGHHGGGRGLVVEGRTETVAEVLGTDVQLVGRARGREEENVAHVRLDSGGGVVEDVDQTCQGDIPPAEATHSEEHGEGQEIRRWVPLNSVGVGVVEDRSNAARKTAGAGVQGVHEGLVDEHPDEVEGDQRHVLELHLQVVGQDIVFERVYVEVGLPGDRHARKARKHAVQGVGMAADQRLHVAHQVELVA